MTDTTQIKGDAMSEATQDICEIVFYLGMLAGVCISFALIVIVDLIRPTAKIGDE